MASIQGWGRQTWSSGAWNTFAPVEASGNGLTSSVGTLSTITTNIFGVTGNQLTSSIGDAAQASEYAVTGNAVTSALGTMPNPTIVDNQLLTGWNRGVGTSIPLGWNASSWGNGDFILSTSNGLSGASMTSSLGEESPTGNADVTATGVGLTSTIGTAAATGVAVATPSGNVITPSIGTETVTGTSTVTATGVGLTSQIGDEDAQGVRQSGWNRGANQVTGELIGWGDNLWGTLTTSYALTGAQATTATTAPAINTDFNITVTGVGLTGSTGVLGGFAQATGVSATSSIGTFSISGDAQLTVVAASEPEMDALTGSVSVTIGKTAFPPGNAITSSLGSLTVTGTGVISPTGVNLTSAIGTEVASTDVNVVGAGGFVTKTVTVISTSSGNKYVIDGVQQPTLELAEGNTYRFDQSDASNDGHPFRFSETPNGSHGGGSQYTTGVTTNGTPGNAGAYTQITVASGAPTLYYYCTVHSGMGGQANTPSSDANGFTANGTTSSVGSATTSAGATVSVSGIGLTLSLGDETQETSYEAPSVSLTSSLGSLTITGTSTLTLTGVSATSSVGNLQGTFWSAVDDSNSAISWTEVNKAA
jgi:hypothetical protein